MTDSYPIGERRGMWAFDVIKLLHKTGAAKQLGPGAVLIVAHVAIGEHREDYLIPPSFWNSELMTASGISDDEAFVSARGRAVKAGWLCYAKGGIRQAGQYWAMVPKAIQERLACHRKNRIITGSSPDHDRIMTGSSPDHDRTMTGSSPDHDRDLSLPLPSPIPNQGESANPPAQPSHVSKKSDNTAKLKKRLRQLGLTATDDAAREWGDFLTGPLVRCKSPDEVFAILPWIVMRLSESGQVARYAKQAVPIASAIRAEVIARRKATEGEVTP